MKKDKYAKAWGKLSKREKELVSEIVGGKRKEPIC
jgi:hypothetical protein